MSYNNCIEKVKKYYHCDKVTKVMETLICVLILALLISLIFKIGILIFISGVGIIITLMLEWAYIGIILCKC